MDKTGIEILIKKYLETRDEIIFVYLHGSFVEHDFYRDIDAGLFLDEKKVPDIFNYELQLYNDLREHTRLEIDAHVINKAPLGFVFHVLRGKLLFTRDELFLSDFIEKVGLEFSEFDYHRKYFLKDVLS